MEDKEREEFMEEVLDLLKEYATEHITETACRAFNIDAASMTKPRTANDIFDRKLVMNE
jgi:hypothetical protein